MIPIDEIRNAAVGYLESHAVDLGRYIVKAISLYIRDRKTAEKAIDEAHAAYTKTFDDIEAHMKAEP